MLIAHVIGTVVATRKHEQLTGCKIQVVQPLDHYGKKPIGEPFVAVDAVGAGVGEQVMIVRGSGARIALNNDQAPVDATIIGIVDHIDIEEEL
jgi:ethanolamine utilization protein EutN